MISSKSDLNWFGTVLLSLIFYFMPFCFIIGQKNPSAEKYIRLAEEYKMRSMPDSAVYFLKQAAVEFKANQKTEKLITTYQQIGSMLTREEKFEEARMYFGMADVQGDALRDTNDLLRAATFTGLGIIYSSVGDFKGALKYHERALAMRIIKLGKNDAAVATSHSYIGGVYLTMKNYDAAIEEYEKTLVIKEKLFGKESLEAAQTYTNLGLVFREKKDFATALDYLQKALQIKVSHGGQDNKDMIKIYNMISGVYHMMGDKVNEEMYKAKEDSLK